MKTAIKTSLVIMIVCGAVSAAWAGVTAMMGSTTRPAPQPDEPKLVRMTVSAQDEPDPALKYHLLPTVVERKPGNAILMYYVAQQLFPDRGDSEETTKRRDRLSKYLEMPLADLPAEDVENLLSYYRNVLKNVEIGAMRDHADWGLEFDEGLAMIIPSFSDFRDIARVLALRARMEIAQGRFDQAIHTIKVGMALGRHMSEGTPLLITALVGIAIESLMLDRVQELISHGGPNLYWALADLPYPLADIRPAFDWERQWLATSHDFRKAMAGPMTPAEGTELLGRMVGLYWLAINHSIDPPGRHIVVQAAVAARFYGVGKRALIEGGRSRQEVEAMPVGQVVALYLIGDYVHWQSELLKSYSLPYWQARPGLQRSEKAFLKWRKGGGWVNPLTTLVPALGQACFIQARLDRTRAALQAIESIRSYAAHYGRAPQSLDELELPVPIDPVTGKQFQYESKDQSFTLIGPAPEGENAKEGFRYEVQLTPARKAPTATAPAPAAPPTILPAEGPWVGIERFIQDETIAVVRIDLAALTSDAAWQQISTIVKESKLGESQGDKVLAILTQVRDKGRQIVQAGAKEAFVVVNVTDIPAMPMIVVPLGKDADADKLADVLSRIDNRSTVHRIDGALVVATENQLRLLQDLAPAKRPRLANALASCNGPVRVALALSDDAMRAINEAIGTLPPEVGGMPATMLTRGLQWACLDITLQPEISLRLVAQSADAESAKALSAFINLALSSAANARRYHGHPQDAGMYEAIAAAMQPQVRGNQLVLQMSQAQIIALLRDAISRARRTPSTMPTQPD